MTTPRQKIWGGIGLIIAAALLYLFTLDTGLRPNELNGGDLITHQYAQVEGRPSNAPGYPLYTMGGWLWFHLSRPLLQWFFNPTQILSMYSMLWGLGSLILLYLILLKISRVPIALGLTAFYATTYFFWYYSVTTEQYSSAVFQTLLMLWLAFQWDETPRPALLLAMACLSGTMLANMLTTLFILLPILSFILLRPSSPSLPSPSPQPSPKGRGSFKPPLPLGEGWGEGKFPYLRIVINNTLMYLQQPWLVLQGIAVTTLPLLSYAYIYIRGAQHPEWRGAGQWATAWEWFVQFITIQQGRDELAPGLSLQQFFTAEFPSLMWHELTPLVFFGGLVGIATLGGRRAWLCYATLLIYAPFCWAYRFGNWFQVIIPAYPLMVIGMAALINKLEVRSEKLEVRGEKLEVRNEKLEVRSKKLEYGVNLGLVLLIMYSLVMNFPRSNQRHRPDDTGLAPGEAILADQPIAPATVYTDFYERIALQYLQTMGGLGQRLQIIEAENPTLPHFVQRYATRQALSRQPSLLKFTHPQAIGAQLIALELNPLYLPPSSARYTTLQFGTTLRLVAWESRPAPAWQITLYWQASQPITQNYTISVRPLVQGQILTHNGENLIQDHEPVWGFFPTSQWKYAEIVRDVYALTLPVEPDAVQIVVYHATATGFENVGVQELQVR